MSQPSSQVLGKRKTSYAYRRPPPKRMYRGASPYGSGYNPKAVSRRTPPPNAEKKYSDTSGATQLLANAATSSWPAYTHIQSFNQIAQGDGMNGRNGNKITVTSFTLRMEVGIDRNTDASWSGLVSSDTPFRIVLYIDTQHNGAGPTIDDFFQDEPTSTEQLFVFNKLEETGRFKVLMDKMIVVQNQAVVYDGTNLHSTGGTKVFKKHFKLDLPIMYGDSTNNLASIRTNNIGMFVMSKSDDHRTFSIRARLRYYDY